MAFQFPANRRVLSAIFLVPLVLAPVATATHDGASAEPKIPPLPGSPAVKRTAHALIEFEGQDHRPKVDAKWKYRVEATNRSRRPLAGTVRTRFLYHGTFIGNEAPPRHKLKHGKLTDTLTFPPLSAGIHLAVQVVVTTRYGAVKLQWPVTPRK
jgi:hypothetical protein